MTIIKVLCFAWPKSEILTKKYFTKKHKFNIEIEKLFYLFIII